MTGSESLLKAHSKSSLGSRSPTEESLTMSEDDELGGCTWRVSCFFLGRNILTVFQTASSMPACSSRPSRRAAKPSTAARPKRPRRRDGATLAKNCDWSNTETGSADSVCSFDCSLPAGESPCLSVPFLSYSQLAVRKYHQALTLTDAVRIQRVPRNEADRKLTMLESGGSNSRSPSGPGVGRKG